MFSGRMLGGNKITILAIVYSDEILGILKMVGGDDQYSPGFS